MLSVAEALSAILAHARPLACARVALADALGAALAEDVASDVDSPPHDKAMVDGYATLAADLATGSATLRVIEQVTAGEVPRLPVAQGQATRIMTGAPIPAGADAVVMVERSNETVDGGVTLVDAHVVAGQNILPRGSSLVRGQHVLAAGTAIRAIEIGILAEVGRAEVAVTPRPSVAILATGNELVPPAAVPGAGQIRNSNGPMLAAAARESGATAIDLGIVGDDANALAHAIETGLASDVLLLSGGVSAGVLDLVPGVLKSLGVAEVFHKVNLKPGKPIWFGFREAAGRSTLVFGLPGNPVGSWVCFELFVRPALLRLAGRADVGKRKARAALDAPVAQRGERPTYYPAAYRARADGATVRPLGWKGSADLAALAGANALIVLPPGDRKYAPGESVDVYLPWGEM